MEQSAPSNGQLVVAESAPPVKKRRRGRRKGVGNRPTMDVRQAIAIVAMENVGYVCQWLDEIKDPAKRLELFLRALEYHIPKLSRAEVTGEGGAPLQVQVVHYAVRTNGADPAT